jgi:4-hydroxybenzoate polyprenyltransferase
MVNRPERTALCEHVGYDRLKAIARSGFVLLILFGGVWLAWTPTILGAALLVISDFLVYNYSFGLRLSRSRFGSIVVLAFPFVGPFVGGWALAHPELNASAWHEFAAHSLPVLLIGGLLLASLSWVKDVTDIIGDKLIGYSSGWLAMVRGNAAIAGAIVASVPFIFLVILASLAAIASRYLTLIVFLPVALLLANGTRIAAYSTEQMAVREFFYNYWMVVLAVLAVLTIPTGAGVVIAVLCLTYWRLATAFLHWTGSGGVGWIPAVLRLNFRGSDSQPRRVAQ